MGNKKDTIKSIKKSMNLEGPSTIASLKKFGSSLWKRIKGKDPKFRKKRRSKSTKSTPRDTSKDPVSTRGN